MIALIALYVLGQPGDIRALGSPRWAEREAAVEQFRAAPLELTLGGLESADPEIRRNTLRIIRRKDPCSMCHGATIVTRWNKYTGLYEDGVCPTCGGFGSPWLKDRLTKRGKLCRPCSGAGRVLVTEAIATAERPKGEQGCLACGGSGFR